MWDFCEVFGGTGHLSAAHRAVGLRVHPGFDIADGAKGNALKASTFSAIIGLICRRVVKSWHAGRVCTTFGTLRRPRLRSKFEPFGSTLQIQLQAREISLPCVVVSFFPLFIL